MINIYPLITVKFLEQSRDFFVKNFAMKIVFEANWVVILSSEKGESITLGLMTHDHPSNPPGPEVFNGLGMIMTVQVEDVSALYGKLKERGVAVSYELKDEPWGQRRFMVVDPSGIKVDVVQQTEPVAGFWEKYI